MTVTVDRREALRRLAADYKASPAEALEDLLTFALDEDAVIAAAHVAGGQAGALTVLTASLLAPLLTRKQDVISGLPTEAQ